MSMVVNLKLNNKDQQRLPKENGMAQLSFYITIQSIHFPHKKRSQIGKPLPLALVLQIFISQNRLLKLVDRVVRFFRLSLLQRELSFPDLSQIGSLAS